MLTGTHAFVHPGSDKGLPHLTMDWDNLVDVPLRKPLERLDPMAATASQLYPTAHGMTNRPNMCAKPVKHRNRIGRGSPTFEHTVLGAKESKCGEVARVRASSLQAPTFFHER